MSGFPSWKPQAGAGPPSSSCLSRSSTSLLRAPLCRHPQWNQAQICCQEGRHFLDCHVKGACTGTHSNPPPCPPPVHIQTTRDTQRHGWTQRPPVHTGGSTWSASDLRLTDKYKHSRVPPPHTHSAHHRLQSTQFPARGAHRHAQTQSHAGPCRAEEQVQTRSMLSPCTSTAIATTRAAAARYRHNPRNTTRAACSWYAQPSPVTQSDPLHHQREESAGHRDTLCPRPGLLDQSTLLHSVFLGTETCLKSHCTQGSPVHAQSLSLGHTQMSSSSHTVTSLASCTQ